MISFPFLINLLFSGLIFILSSLCLVVAVTRARDHLIWLIPTAIGWGLRLIAGLLNLAFMSAFRQSGFSASPLRSLLGTEQWIYILGFACLVWAAGALYWMLQSMGPAPPAAWGEGNRGQSADDGKPGGEGSWPPPPSPPAAS